MKQATSHNFPTGITKLRLLEAGNKFPWGEFERAWTLSSGSSPFIARVLSDRHHGMVNFAHRNTSSFIFNGSCYSTLPPTDHPLREWCNVQYCGSSGTATTQPLQSNSPATFIPTFLPFLVSFIEMYFLRKSPHKSAWIGMAFPLLFFQEKRFSGGKFGVQK